MTSIANCTAKKLWSDFFHFNVKEPQDTFILALYWSFASTEDIPVLSYWGSCYFVTEEWSLLNKLSHLFWIILLNLTSTDRTNLQCPTSWKHIHGNPMSPGQYTRFVHCLLNSVSKHFPLCLWQEKNDYVWLKGTWWFVSINYWDQSALEWNDY